MTNLAKFLWRTTSTDGRKKEQDVSTRKVAMLALSHLGSDAKPATQALNQALQDKNPDIRATAAHALKYINQTAT